MLSTSRISNSGENFHSPSPNVFTDVAGYMISEKHFKIACEYDTLLQVDLKKIINTGIFDMDEAAKSAGWLQSLMADTPHTPETLEYGISSFIYKYISFLPWKSCSMLKHLGSRPDTKFTKPLNCFWSYLFKCTSNFEVGKNQ